MKKTILLFLLVFSSIYAVHAQADMEVMNTDSTTNKLQFTDALPNQSITFSPSALLNFRRGIQIGYEKKIAPTVLTEIELAYLMPNSHVPQYKSKGLRIKWSTKFFQKSTSSLQGIILYRREYVDRIDHFARFNEAYFERIEYSQIRTTLGIAFNIAGHIKLSRRFHFEYGIGAGLGTIYIKNSDIPLDAEIERTFSPLGDGVYSKGGRWPFPIGIFNLKLKYAL